MSEQTEGKSFINFSLKDKEGNALEGHLILSEIFELMRKITDNPENQARLTQMLQAVITATTTFYAQRKE